MKKILLGSLVLAGSFMTQSAFAGPSVLSLAELKAKCHEKESDAQIMKFNSTFVCSEDKTFWVAKGEKRFVLENQSTVKIKALIKDDRHQTDWWEVPSTTEQQAAVCPVMEQWKTTARYSVTIKSCDQLDLVASEEVYCREKLATTWAECDAERQLALTAPGGFSLPKAPLCEYEATGVLKSCSEEGPTHPQEDQCQQDGKGDKGCGTKDSSSSSSSSDDQKAGVQSEFEVGASLREIEVKRSFWHRRHKVVVVDSVVLENSLLDQLDMKQGDMVSRVNDRRTKDIRTFLRFVKEAKNRGEKVKLEYRGKTTDQKFVEKLVDFK